MKEERKRSGYQPIKTNIENPIPPSTGSNVEVKKHGYTWKDVDKAWWEGFDCCKEKLEKKNADLEETIDKLREQFALRYEFEDNWKKENAELREQIEKMKFDVKKEQSYWNSGEMQYTLLQRLLDKWN